MVVSSTFINTIREAVADDFETNLSHIATGDTDTPAPADTDTTLNNETYREALFAESSNGTYNATLFLDTAENNGNDIKECGLFTAAVAGDMYAHNLTNVIQKSTSIEVFIEYVISFNIINI